MFNNPSLLNTLTTEQIQKYLEENNELILASLEYQKQGKTTESAQCQAKLQHNLTYLTKVADIGSQVPLPSQVSSQAAMQQRQGMQQPHVAMFESQLNLSTLNLPLEINEQQHQAMYLHQSTSKFPLQINDRQQHHAMSLHQPNISTSKRPLQIYDQQHHQQQHLPMSLHQPNVSTNLPLHMNEQNYKFPFFQYQQQLIPIPRGSLPASTNNSTICQNSQTRLNNMSDTPSSNQTSANSGLGW